MSTPQINDINVPFPSASSAPEFKEAFRGAGREMADGSVVFDWVTAARKRIWTLKWVNLLAADMEILRTAYNTIATGTSTKWEPSDGGTFYVTLDPSSMTLDVQVVKVAGTTPRYNVGMTLREV